MTDTEKAVSARVAAETFGCSRPTIYRMIRDKQIPAFRLHGDKGDWRIFLSEARQSLRQQAESPDLWAPPSRKKRVRA